MSDMSDIHALSQTAVILTPFICSTCSGGQWDCTDDLCPGSCTTWGESNYQSFDGRGYQFVGSCSYIMATTRGKNTTSHGRNIDVIVENLPCGSAGMTCAKSVELITGDPGLKTSTHKTTA